MSARYDLIVIGSGPGGYRAAVLATLRGLNVAIVERAQWGGCCLNRGCVPKKDWYHSARLVAAARDSAARGLHGELHADMNGAWDHQRQVVTTVRGSYLDYMKRMGITAYQGYAALQDAQTVRIARDGGEVLTLHSDYTILATGSVPSAPEGLAPVPARILTTDMLFDERPPAGERVALIGSGVVATEFAFIFTQLGKQVEWLTRSAPLHRTRFSPQALSTLKVAFRRHGIAPRLCQVKSAQVHGDGVRLVLESGEMVDVDWVCLGTGRAPNSAGLGLERAGIGTDGAGFIRRNAFLQTDAPNVYAIGDCASASMTSNQALADATVAVHNIIAGNTRRQDDQWIPLVIYSAVELARIGLDDEQAEDAGLEPAVGFAAFETSPCALGQDDVDGFVRLLGDMDSGALLGGEIVGTEAGELIHLLSLAPDRDTALRWLASGRYNHPARAEELINATETLASKWGLKEYVFE